MTPVHTKHSRQIRSAKDARGIYAPPGPEARLRAGTDQHEPAPEAANLLKRKRPQNATNYENVEAEASHLYPPERRTSWRLNKKDKRTIKHNALLARVHGARVEKEAKKRRRPSKKLKADLGSLGDALPDIELAAQASKTQSEDEWEGLSEEENADGGCMEVEGLRTAVKRRRRVMGDVDKMRMRSLKHRPGAMKRKRKMEQGEMERFTRNLVQMVDGGKKASVNGSGDANAGTVPSPANRWAALRRFIDGTMEKSVEMTGR